MIRATHWFFVLVLATLAWRADAAPRPGVISYWGLEAQAYDKVPAGAIALVNPDNGILRSAGGSLEVVPDLALHRAIVDKASARGVQMLGYVPTGYFRHGCDRNGECQSWQRIEAQVRSYLALMPSLVGIFFDEVSPAAWDCNAFRPEYERLRSIVRRYRPDAVIAFNAAVPDNCAVSGAAAGEILVLFEGTPALYATHADVVRESTRTAMGKGIRTWHLVHSARSREEMQRVLILGAKLHVDRMYVTDIGGDWQNGDNTWGAIPGYWQAELAQMSALAGQNPPLCSTLERAGGEMIVKVVDADIGEPGIVHLEAQDPMGQRWLHDGVQWVPAQKWSGRARYALRVLEGFIPLSHADLGRAAARSGLRVMSMWARYSLASSPAHHKGTRLVCSESCGLKSCGAER